MNILKNDKKNEKAHRYLKTQYIDTEYTKTMDKHDTYNYNTTYNITPEIPRSYDDLSIPTKNDSSTNR